MIEIYGSKNLGITTRDLRKKARLSQGRLAELAGLSRTAIQSLEAGKETCQLDTVFKVLKVLNVHVHLSHPLIDES
jgi:y4mF family transcriptional regulator